MRQSHPYKAFCKRQLEATNSQKYIFELLEAADALGAVEMKAHLLAAIAANFSEACRLPRMQHLRRELLLDVLDVRTLLMFAQQHLTT